MTNLLLELFQEEIPARMQARAAADLEKLVVDGLKAAGLTFAEARTLVTPRRLVLMIDGLPERQPDVTEEKKGPKVGAPEQAVAGFLKGNGLTSIDQAEVRDPDGKGAVYFAVKHVKGRETAAVLKDIIEAALTAFPWPKSMKWGTGQTRWVRPLQSMICLFGDAVIPVAFAGVTAGAATTGHRFLAPGPIVVTDAADYKAKLRAAKVMLDPTERAETILNGARALAGAAGLTLLEDDGLLREVAGLIEWPVVLMGSFDPAFLAVPREVLTTAMRAHQKYFSCLNADGSLAPRFIVVANMETADGGHAIVAGNQRVLRARLSDAKFFWDNDLKKSLDDFVPKLKDIVFHAKLGTVAEKISRMETLAADIARIIGANADQATHAARLCKADLVSEMVYEFPEVQGIMGRYYALKHGEAPEVANAIAEHYSPLGPNDDCPTAPVSVAVALADKIDTLCGFWVIDEKPTGSKDPYALRRAALGVIRLILENGLRVNLLEVFKASANLLPPEKRDAYNQRIVSGAATEDETVDRAYAAVHMTDLLSFFADLLSFFADRLKVHLKEKGVRHDLIEAVFALGDEDDLVRLLARVDALTAFVSSDDGANLLAAHKRAANILRIEEAKDKTAHDGPVDPALFELPEETALYAALDDIAPAVDTHLTHEDFAKAMSALAQMRKPVDHFFDKVMVNVENQDVRVNRLRTLSRIVRTMSRIADFSRIEGT